MLKRFANNPSKLQAVSPLLLSNVNNRVSSLLHKKKGKEKVHPCLKELIDNDCFRTPLGMLLNLLFGTFKAAKCAPVSTFGVSIGTWSMYRQGCNERAQKRTRSLRSRSRSRTRAQTRSM